MENPDNEILKKLVKKIEFDKNKMTGTYVRRPDRSELNPEINEALIVEFYNR